MPGIHIDLTEGMLVILGVRNCYAVCRKYYEDFGLIFSLLYCHTVNYDRLGIILSSARL